MKSSPTQGAPDAGAGADPCRWSRREVLGTVGAGVGAAAWLGLPGAAQGAAMNAPAKAGGGKVAAGWRSRAGTVFECHKQSAIGSRGMVVTNHPLASAAGAQILAEGGNAVDAAVAALFTLCIVEPQMVSILGGGLMHLRTPDGKHRIFDGLSVAPAAARPDMYQPLDGVEYDFRKVAANANSIGALSVAVPGNLAVWAAATERFGRLPLSALTGPAVRYARHGFPITPYLARAIKSQAKDVAATDAGLAQLLLPGGNPLSAGERLVQEEAARSLEIIARDGARALYDGELGQRVADYVSGKGGILTRADLRNYPMKERAPVRGTYRGFEIVGPPPPAAGGMLIVEMLNVLEGFDLKALGFGSADTVHLIAEALKLAFADRAMALADPEMVRVPVEKLTSREYADRRRKELDPKKARDWAAGIPAAESYDTTHVTVADSEGNVVSATHTVNGGFGSCLLVPGVGFIPDNYMFNLDPRPGRTLSIAPGKRVTSSQSPVMVLEGGKVRHALGLPGGLTIFGSAMQAIIDLVDHGMTLQEAVESPRVWTQGDELQVEEVIPEAVVAALRERGHRVQPKPRIGNGMNAVSFLDDGRIEGAACWRADGTPIGVSGGPAHADALR
jgi:gamma-glutamyltranspeptidase/glutathione hydrolase